MFSLLNAYLLKNTLSDAINLDSSAHVASAKAVMLAARKADTALGSSTGLVVDMGAWDASSGNYPAKPYVGSGETARLVSAFWKVTQAGTVDSVPYGVGDELRYTAQLDEFYKLDHTESVTSVNGKTGAVVLKWSDILDAPTSLPYVHTHLWAQISDKPASYPPNQHDHHTLTTQTITNWNALNIPNGFVQGDRAANAPTDDDRFWGFNMTHSGGEGAQIVIQAVTGECYVRNRNINGQGPWIRLFSSYNKPRWQDITGKPNVFRPSSHTHDWGHIENKPEQATRWPSWREVTGKPAVGNGWVRRHVGNGTQSALNLSELLWDWSRATEVCAVVGRSDNLHGVVKTTVTLMVMDNYPGGDSGSAAIGEGYGGTTVSIVPSITHTNINGASVTTPPRLVTNRTLYAIYCRHV